MSILADKNTRLLVQGITGAQGRFHTGQMLAYGSNIVAGVTPRKGGARVEGIPVFDTVEEAARSTGANASVIFVPPAAAADSILEAVDARLDFTVCITEGIPVLDMVRVKRHMQDKTTKLIGPNCPGVISPDLCKAGIMPGNIHRRGHVGVVSRSGTLTYEAVDQLTRLGLGQSTAIGIGGDPVKGLGFTDVLSLFEADPDTCAVVLIGEIGGEEEQKAAAWIKNHMSKPVVAFIAGKTAPSGKRMGHAGAIISGARGTASQKIQALEASGVAVAKTLDEIGPILVRTLQNAGCYEQCLCREEE
jgi:succinyl-CoA synthetase alpha subunit